MRYLLFLINIKIIYKYKELLIRFTEQFIFNNNKRDSLNLCFKAVLVKRKRVYIIFR